MEYKEYLEAYERHLNAEERSGATVEKYMRDIRHFLAFLEGRPISKEETLAYKQQQKGLHATTSVNSMLAAVNGFLRFMGLEQCRVHPLKIQRQLFCPEEKELSQAEYQRLLTAARGSRLEYVLRTICGTGIRVSELQYITVEAVSTGRAVVRCKNKTRVIFIPVSLQKLLRVYIKKAGIKAGAVFVSRSGKPLNRSNIWRDMKALCKKAGVPPQKVFPHNLRHLFARTFYAIDRDIVRLADLLGHSSINTTRIYTVEAGSRHMVQLEQVQRQLMT